MFIELVDQLRCPRAHDPTWLVASIDQVSGRDVLEGTLGCPICATRYPVTGGVADLRIPEQRTARATRPSIDAADEDALHVAAFLDLVEPGGFVLLAGDWAELAPTLVRLIDGVHALAVNPMVDLAGIGGVSSLLASDGMPVRAGAARGVALDARHSTAAALSDAVNALRAGGRMVAPASAPVPGTLALLARDGRHWVAERTAGVSAPMPLTRAERP